MTTKYRCDNCESLWNLDDLHEIKDYWMRVDEDGPEPDGECPDCGCLCYELADERRQDQ